MVSVRVLFTGKLIHEISTVLAVLQESWIGFVNLLFHMVADENI
jgi:hypothetical protein